jgi:hypothetical protein
MLPTGILERPEEVRVVGRMVRKTDFPETRMRTVLFESRSHPMSWPSIWTRLESWVPSKACAGVMWIAEID